MSGGDNSQGPGAGFNTMEQSQGEQGGYDSVRQSQTNTQHDMGGGQGIQGSGVAGGYTGSSGHQTGTGGPTGQAGQAGQAEKQDWLDKGISMAGQKLGINVSQQNADKAGDFINKEFSKREGRNLPGVQ